MDELFEDFRSLKISALTKAAKISPFVNSVTLGPNSVVQETKNDVEEVDVKKNDKKDVIKVTTKSVENVSPLKKLLIEFEIQRQEGVQQAIDFRRKQILTFQKRQETELKNQWFQQQQKMIQKMQQQELQILQALEEHDKDLSAQHQKLLKYYQELAERRKKKDEELQAKEQRKKELHGIIDKIKKDQVEFRTIYQEIINVLKTNTLHDSVKSSLTEISQQLKTLPSLMEEVIAKCKMGKISENEAGRSTEILRQLVAVKHEIFKVLKDHDEQEKQIKEQERINGAKLIEVSGIDASASSNDQIVNKSDATEMRNLAVKIDNYVSKQSLRIYLELQQFLQNHEDLYKQLEQNESLKQFKFDCKKAVNIPVNAISAVTSHHLLDKYSRLTNLLSGKPVAIGESQMSANKHPQGITFCMNLLAKKFVLQGDLMISSNPEAAFCYAAVILALWNDYPDFGKLLLAHFHKQCPYIIPFYIPKAVDQTDEEYYMNLGYQYNDGVVEKQDKFLKRMTGIMRLYSAILIAKPKRGQSQINPHGLPQAWRWLASILNLEPRSDITATMLHVFLETTGYILQNTYGKEFKRMIYFIMVSFMPIMKKIDSGGPALRLELLLQEYKQKGYFEQPSGMLPNNFW